MLVFESYEEHERHLPSTGKYIIAQFTKEYIVVYQAFKDSIAEYAVANQKFGGDDYDFGRVTWLKPSFLWMMYYSGWANKQNQENVLAIKISIDGFEHILRHAVLNRSFIDSLPILDIFRKNKTPEQVQWSWETYHDLRGSKTDRKAVKIGLSGDILQRFNNEWILEIQNVTEYVKQQQLLVKEDKISKVLLPRERAYAPNDLTILKKIDATSISL
ncbi:MAG: DUF4291 domain-containing protein [Sphingobacteriales bacterium]|nr:MAG: DUF4291 domain-containing protein [Sphingobacteriales bacterium]